MKELQEKHEQIAKECREKIFRLLNSKNIQSQEDRDIAVFAKLRRMDMVDRIVYDKSSGFEIDYRVNTPIASHIDIKFLIK